MEAPIPFAPTWDLVTKRDTVITFPLWLALSGRRNRFLLEKNKNALLFLSVGQIMLSLCVYNTLHDEKEFFYGTAGDVLVTPFLIGQGLEGNHHEYAERATTGVGGS